jgi:hypothetical protein
MISHEYGKEGDRETYKEKYSRGMHDISAGKRENEKQVKMGDNAELKSETLNGIEIEGESKRQKQRQRVR